MQEALQKSFKVILAIQELDVKMIRLLKVKKERQEELTKIQTLKSEIQIQLEKKEKSVLELKKEVRVGETQIKELEEKVSKLESQQAAVKKMDEFNALTQEMTACGRQRKEIEQRLSDLMDQLAAEEDLLVTLKENLQSTETSSALVEKEIHEGIDKINEEGRTLLQERDALKDKVDPEMFQIYERRLKNRKDRVVVPIENRTCSGCHIVLTPQHENLVRKGDRLVFCEHCSCLLFWQDNKIEEPGEAAPRRRRRKVTE